jgi:hypothetical protein
MILPWLLFSITMALSDFFCKYLSDKKNFVKISEFVEVNIGDRNCSCVASTSAGVNRDLTAIFRLKKRAYQFKDTPFFLI